MTIGVASADQRTGQRVGKDQGRWRSTVSAVGGWRFRRLGKGLAREAKGRERERGYKRFRHVLPPFDSQEGTQAGFRREPSERPSNRQAATGSELCRPRGSPQCHGGWKSRGRWV